MKNIFRKFFLLFLLLSLCGCGYKFGTIGHPQLTSIAVAPVINETLTYNASAIMRGLLAERFTTDGTLKLKSLSKADCILYAKITDVSFSAVDYGTAPDGNDTYLANEWSCNVTVSYSVVIPGRGRPLIANRTISGSSRFLNGPDLETSRNNAARQALFSAAKSIVSGITEGW